MSRARLNQIPVIHDGGNTTVANPPLFSRLNPLIADVWASSPADDDDVYNLYSHDPEIEERPYDAAEHQEFVTRLREGLAQLVGEAEDGQATNPIQVEVLSEEAFQQRMAERSSMWILPQQAPHPADAASWASFLHIWWGAPATTRYRVYARFETPLDALAGALEVAANIGFHPEQRPHDHGIWEWVTNLKVGAPGTSHRRDQLVVYLSDAEGVEPVANLLRDAQARGELRLRPGVPPGLRIVDQNQPAIGTAAEPPRIFVEGRWENQSFGGVLAEVIYEAYAATRDLRDFAAYRQAVHDGLVATGMNPEAPYEPYEEPDAPPPPAYDDTNEEADVTDAPTGYADVNPAALTHH